MKKLIFTLEALSFIALTACHSAQNESLQRECSAFVVGLDSVEITDSYTASIRGRQDVEIYPQVSGTITDVCVTEGARVRRGDVLFVIDQIPYQAALQSATANVHVAEAQVETARLTCESKQELFREEVISEYDLQMARNELSSAEAALEQCWAQETNARNNLSYTEVKSPTDGVVGTLPYRVGTLVGASLPQPLTTVSDNAEMYVYFSMTANRFRALVRGYGSPDEMIARMPQIRLRLNDGTMYEQPGRVESISGVINPQTGTVSLRSVFPNKNRLLLSGDIGNVIIPHTEREAMIIPQSATYELQDKVFVYKIVDGHIVSVPVEVTPTSNSKEYIVRTGLQAGDVIVEDGVGLLHDGMEITIKE